MRKHTRKSKYILAFILLLSLLLMGGCQGRGYSKKDAKSIMTEFIQEKYGDVPEFEWVRWHRNKDYSQGYYAKTKEGYYIRMNVFTQKGEKPKYRCLDTREYPKVEEVFKAVIADNPLSDNYEVFYNPISEDSPDELWESLQKAAEQKWDGDLEKFLSYPMETPHYAFFNETNTRGSLYIAIRPDSLTDYVNKYGSFSDYVKNLKEGFSDVMSLNALVVTPSLPVQALKDLNLLQLTTFGLVNYEQSKPVMIPSQAEGVEGYFVEDPYSDSPVATDSLALLSADPPKEPISRFTDESFRVISPLYRVDKASNINISLLFDFSVILKNYLLENPKAQLGRDFVLLEIDEYGNVDPVTLPVYSAVFPSPEAWINYLTGDNKYTYTDSYYKNTTQICFAVPVKETAEE